MKYMNAKVIKVLRNRKWKCSEWPRTLLGPATNIIRILRGMFFGIWVRGIILELLYLGIVMIAIIAGIGYNRMFLNMTITNLEALSHDILYRCFLKKIIIISLSSE